MVECTIVTLSSTMPIKVLDVCEHVMNVNSLGLGEQLAFGISMDLVVDATEPSLEGVQIIIEINVIMDDVINL